MRKLKKQLKALDTLIAEKTGLYNNNTRHRAYGIALLLGLLLYTINS